jgi:hypothetical protein
VREPAYITIAEDGHLTLFWGDGTEPDRIAILRGPRPPGGQELIRVIEQMTAWAAENGYDVVVPARDLAIPPVDLSISDQEARTYPEDEVYDLLDDLYGAGGYDEDDFEAR